MAVFIVYRFSKVIAIVLKLKFLLSRERKYFYLYLGQNCVTRDFSIGFFCVIFKTKVKRKYK